jgi:hypothetical protein
MAKYDANAIKNPNISGILFTFSIPYERSIKSDISSNPEVLEAFDTIENIISSFYKERPQIYPSFETQNSSFQPTKKPKYANNPEERRYKVKESTPNGERMFADISAKKVALKRKKDKDPNSMDIDFQESFRTPIELIIGVYFNKLTENNEKALGDRFSERDYFLDYANRNITRFSNYKRG